MAGRLGYYRAMMQETGSCEYDKFPVLYLHKGIQGADEGLNGSNKDLCLNRFRPRPRCFLRTSSQLDSYALKMLHRMKKCPDSRVTTPYQFRMKWTRKSMRFKLSILYPSRMASVSCKNACKTTPRRDGPTLPYD